MENALLGSSSLIRGNKCICLHLPAGRIEFGHPSWEEAHMFDSNCMPHWSIVYYDYPDNDVDAKEDEDNSYARRVAYWAPNSSHLPFPPTNHWLPANRRISADLGEPRVKYL